MLDWLQHLDVDFAGWLGSHLVAVCIGVVGTVLIGFRYKGILLWLLRIFGGSDTKEFIENLNNLHERIRQHEKNEQEWKEKASRLETQLRRYKTRTSNLHDDNKSLAEQLQHVDESDKVVWSRPAAENHAPFVPKHQRRSTIISMANLKGGVGKTTITGNVAVTLAKDQKRVLIMDLDYQGSLTHLVTPPRIFQEMLNRQLFLEKFLEERSENALKLMRFAEEVFCDGNGKVDIIASSDALADIELRLMSKWVAEYKDADCSDVRFLLRKVLHSPEVYDAYDYVLLDCPPRLTTMCINALCACDYLLIPVTLDAVSTEAAIRLLGWIAKRRKDLNPPFEYLGVLANRTAMYGGDLTRDHQNIWTNLQNRADQEVDEELYFFETKIPRSQAYTNSMEGNLPSLNQSERIFELLNKEIKERIADRESDSPKNVSEQPDASTSGQQGEQYRTEQS